MESTTSFAAFVGGSLFGRGELPKVLAAVKASYEVGQAAGLLIFDNESGKQVDFDLHASLPEILARLEPAPAKAGPGRPRLGVTSAEVTLLPRHWEWLERQPQKASGTLRRLVGAAMKNPTDEERARLRIDVTSHFLWPVDIVEHMWRMIGEAREKIG